MMWQTRYFTTVIIFDFSFQIICVYTWMSSRWMAWKCYLKVIIEAGSSFESTLDCNIIQTICSYFRIFGFLFCYITKFVFAKRATPFLFEHKIMRDFLIFSHNSTYYLSYGKCFAITFPLFSGCEWSQWSGVNDWVLYVLFSFLCF